MSSVLGKLNSRCLSSIPPGIVLFCFFFSLYVFTVYGQIRYGDEAERYLQAKSLVEKQTLVIPFIPGEGQTGVGGNAYSQFEIGYGLVVIPFYAVGRLISSHVVLADADWIPVLFTSLSNPLITALTCVVLFAFAHAIGLTSRLALWTSVIFGLATIAWPYSRGLYREALQAFCLLLAVYALFKARTLNSLTWFGVSASAFGYLALTKVANLVMLPVFLGFIAVAFSAEDANWKSVAKWARALKLVGLFLLPTILFLIFQGTINAIKFGNFFDIGPYNYGNPLPYFSLANLFRGALGLLLSPSKGLFAYAPPVLLFLPAWVIFFHRAKTDAVLVFILVVLNILFNGSYFAWEGGSYWGPRYLVEIVPLMILPLGFLWGAGQGAVRWLWRLLSVLVFGIGLGVQLLGVLTNDREYLDLTGRWIDIPGALDFLRHGAIDSLMFSFAPHGEFEISPYGWFLLLLCLLCGLFLIVRVSAKDTEYRLGSRWNNVAVSLIAIGIPLGGLIAWMVPNFSSALVAKGNTKYVAAESFFSDQRFCEAKGFYSEALYFGTPFSKPSASRLEQIAPGPVGIEIDIGDLMALEPDNGSVTIKPDSSVTLFGHNSLEIAAPQGKQVNVEADSRFIPVHGGTQYALFGWLKTSGIAGDGAAILGWYEDNGKWSDSHSLDIVRTSGTHGWSLFTQMITTLPTTRRALLKAGLWESYGTVWIEGLRLIQIDQERSVLAKPLCAP